MSPAFAKTAAQNILENQNHAWFRVIPLLGIAIYLSPQGQRTPDKVGLPNYYNHAGNFW